MKFHKFVGKKDLPITEEEIQSFIEYLKDTDFVYVNTEDVHYVFGNDDYACSKNIIFRHKNYSEESYFEFRDNIKSSLCIRNEVSFHVVKQEGYMDDNTTPPPFQYKCWTYLKGRMREYRHKSWHNSPTVKGVTTFNYGTEFSDFDIKTNLKILSEYMTSVYCKVYPK